jgi:hypothetical protein
MSDRAIAGQRVQDLERSIVAMLERRRAEISKPPTPMRQKTVTVMLPANEHWDGCDACRAKRCVFCGGQK